MESLNDMFFTASKQKALSYDQILEDVQKYCTSRHADKLTTEGNQEEARKLLREFICQYIISRSYHMEGMTTEELCDTLYPLPHLPLCCGFSSCTFQSPLPGHIRSAPI